MFPLTATNRGTHGASLNTTMNRLHSDPYGGHSFRVPADGIVRVVLPLTNAGWLADLDHDGSGIITMAGPASRSAEWLTELAGASPDGTVIVSNIRWGLDVDAVDDLPTITAPQAAWLANLMGQHGYTTHLLAGFPNPDGTPRYRVADLVAPGQPTRLSSADIAQTTEWIETTPYGVAHIRKSHGQTTDGRWN